LRACGQFPERGQPVVRHPPAHREIEFVARDSRRQPNGRQRFRVIPSAEQRIHDSRQVARQRVVRQIGVKVEPGRNAEAIQRRAQDRLINLRAAHDHAHLAEWPARGSLLQDAARDFVRLTLDGGRGAKLDAWLRPLPGTRLLHESHREQPFARGPGDRGDGQRQRDVRMAARGADDGQLRIGQRVESIQPDGVDRGNALARDPFGGVCQTLGARRQSAAAEFAIHLAIDLQKSLAQRRRIAFARHATGEPFRIAPGRREFFHGARQGRTKSRQPDHARKLRPVHAAGGLFDNQIE
jgi:hypothetical protein